MASSPVSVTSISDIASVLRKTFPGIEVNTESNRMIKTYNEWFDLNNLPNELISS